MASSFTHRKLLLSLNNNNNNTNINIPTVETCLYFCNKLKNDTVSTPGYCPTTCLDICPSTCHHSLSTVYNYYTPYQPSIRPHNLSPLLISMLVLLASVFLLITFYVIYTKLCYHFYHFTPHRNSSSGEVTSEEREGTMVFHPIWYLPTVGLNPTVINSIKVIKYEEGVNKESDCAVCLGEFVVGDDLRILPKCNHVFHVPCIDTWLTSHVTCPLCRAPIDPAVDSEYGHTCEISTNNVIRNNNTSAREDESSRDDDVVIAVNNNNNNNNNNNVEDCLEGNTKEQGLENNKGSSSQRWSLERRAADLVSRSFSCSGKIFLSRYNNNNSPSPNS